MVLLFIVSVICGLFYTGLKSKWEVMSGLVVPTLMNASISPEFAQFIYVAGSSLSMAFTPVMAYYVIYIAYMEKYDKNDDVTLFGSFKYMKSYGAVMFALWIILILGFYITGVPMGINSTPGLVF